MTTAVRKPAASTGLTRRTFMQTSAAVGSTVLLVPAVQAASTSLEGYTGAPSVLPGGTLDFFLRDPQAAGTGTTVYPMSFTRVGQPDVYMGGVQISIGNQTVPSDASTNGCRWALTHRLSVPANWPSGLYYAFIGSGSNACTVPFVVRAATAAGTAGVKTLVCVPVLTVHAYNAYGGKSIYDYNSTGGVKATQVSLDRPFTETYNSFFDVWSQYLVRWLSKNNLQADFCTDVDIEAAGSAVLAPYQLYVQAGHDEYWSKNRRDTMEAFVAAGGNCAYLGGNTAWFQSRMAPGNGVANRTLVCYKNAAADPVTDPALKTINFISLATPRPENIMTGSGFLTGCSWVSSLPRPNTPSVTQRPEHWAFAGTGLAQGAGFGGAYVGYECNSAMFGNGSDGRPYPTGVDGTPATLRILAQADGSNWNDLSLAAGGSGEQSGYAHVSVFCNGGAAGSVFSTGSSDWAYGLAPELNGQTATPLSRITLNVINQLTKDWTETADVRQFHKVVNGQWSTYYGASTSAPAGSGMALDGWVFRCFVAPMTGTVPVYRFRSATTGSTGTRYRYSRSAALDASWVSEAVAFHAYAAAGSVGVAVYEHSSYNASNAVTTYLYSTSATAPAGWTSGSIVFHAPTEAASATSPVLPSFTLTAAATSLPVVQGKTVSTAITIARASGFTGAVSFTVAGLPTGAVGTFNLPTTTGSSSTLTVTAGSLVAPGSYPVNVTATGTGIATPVLLALTLVVAAAPVPSFTLALDDTTLSLPLGGLLGLGSDTARVSVVGVNGFAGIVNFSVSGVPSGMTVSMGTPSSTTGTSLTVSRPLFSSLSLGTYPITIKGTSGSSSASATLTVNVAFLF